MMTLQTMRRNRRPFLLVAFLTVILFSVGVLGQQRGSAGLLGRITDSQGAVIPGATITLLHAATNQARTVVSNDEGQYLLPLIPPGEYKLTVEKPGFSKHQRDRILLQVNDNVKLDVMLEVGEITTTLTVEASPVSVDTSSPTIKETVDSKRVVELPLNGRNLADLTLLVPGVQPATGVNGDLLSNSRGPSGQKQLSVNGSRLNNLKYTLDGGDNNDGLFNLNLPFPFPDAVQEFSVQTSNAGLEIGKSSAGAVNIVTKSGTNEYHGNGFWFIRNTALNANGFFSRAPDNLKRNQGGGTFGGPVIRDKLFLFGGYQRTWVRQASGSGSSRSMPADFRRGDFSSLLARPIPIVLVDPLTNAPFPNNVIPVARQSRAAQELLKFSPQPDPDTLTRYTLRSLEDIGEWIARGDYRPSVNHSIMLRYLQQDYENPRPTQPDNIHSVRRGVSAPSKNATLAHTWIFSPNLVADHRLTMARVVGVRSNDFPKTIADFGVKVNPSSNEITVSINGTSGINLNTQRPAVFARTNIEYTNSWRYIKGRHSFLWGADLMGQRYNEYNVFDGSGRYDFNGRITGFDQADFILGALSRFRQSNGEIEFRRQHYQGFYGGDTFRVLPRLTLNFGLRWEPYTPITDLKDRNIQFRHDEYVRGTRSKKFVNAPPGLFFPGDSFQNFTVPKAATASDLNNVAPRVGFAWDVKGDGSTSVRGGYGIFYDTPLLWLLNNMNTQTPFSFTVDYQGSTSSPLLFDDPYRGRERDNVFPFAGDFDPNTPFQNPFPTTALEPTFYLPYVQNWNLTLERRIAGDWLFRLGYVGAKSTRLMADYDQNAPIYDFSRTLQQNQDTVNQRRPRREYQRIATIFTGLNQIYNSLQFSANKRFTRGYSVLASYTWSKNIDYNSINENVLDNLITNPFDFFFGRGAADNDHRQRFVTSFVWNLPDPGKASGSKPLSAIFGGWQVSGIVTLQSGRPFTINSSGDRTAGAARGGGGDARADLVGNLFLSNDRSRGERIARYFNTDAVAQARPGTFGNLGRGVLAGPGYANTDFSVSRSFPLKFQESARLLLRSEFFNLFNRPQLGLPEGTIGRATFGKITTTDADARILQFSLKLEF